MYLDLFVLFWDGPSNRGTIFCREIELHTHTTIHVELCRYTSRQDTHGLKNLKISSRRRIEAGGPVFFSPQVPKGARTARCSLFCFPLIGVEIRALNWKETDLSSSIFFSICKIDKKLSCARTRIEIEKKKINPGHLLQERRLVLAD